MFALIAINTCRCWEHQQRREKCLNYDFCDFRISNDKIITCAFHLDISGSIANRSKSITPKGFNLDNPVCNAGKRSRSWQRRRCWITTFRANILCSTPSALYMGGLPCPRISFGVIHIKHLRRFSKNSYIDISNSFF